MAITTEYNTLPGLRANSTGLATSQFLAGKLASTAGQCILSGALNSTTSPTTFVGIIMNQPGPYEEVELAISGVVKMMVATSTLAVGDRVGVNSTSKGTDAGSTDNGAFLARALEASGAPNDIITVALQGNGGGRY